MLNAGPGNQILATETRKSDRCMLDDEALAGAIFARVRHVIPKTHRGRKVVGLNERLRFLRYRKGDYFVKHMDGTYVRPDGHKCAGDISCLTFLLYLNEEFSGGELEFEWAAAGRDSRRHSDTHAITPTTGLVVVHDHDIVHGAMLTTEGTRYAIRTDVMYR